MTYRQSNEKYSDAASGFWSTYENFLNSSSTVASANDFTATSEPWTAAGRSRQTIRFTTSTTCCFITLKIPPNWIAKQVIDEFARWLKNAEFQFQTVPRGKLTLSNPNLLHEKRRSIIILFHEDSFSSIRPIAPSFAEAHDKVSRAQTVSCCCNALMVSCKRISECSSAFEGKNAKECTD